jgi:hypothetical protein
MRVHLGRYGCCIVTARETVISLGWNIWGFDVAGGRYVVIHLWRPRLFVGRNR